jgi:cation:H+ antiporter
MNIVELLVALVIILLAAELFTNGIEWFGHKLNLAEGAVGSVLAAVGTALPETMIPLVAIIAGSSNASDGAADHIGVGAILGAPFMLSTLAMFVTGIGVLLFRKRRASGAVMKVDTHVLTTDIRYFFVAYVIAIAAALVPPDMSYLRYGAVVALLGVYAWYVKSHFEADTTVDAVDLTPLRFRRVDVRHHRNEPETPRLRIVSLQVLVALAMIIGGAVIFVDAVEHIASDLQLPAILIALVVAPIATELPEKFNSIIWVRGGKDTLAMGNITGAMVFQSCIPTIVGIVLAADAWSLANATPETLISFVSALIAFASTIAIFLPMARRGSLNGNHLLIGGLFYVAFVGLVVARLVGLI